jgi:hypothetical protein
MPIDICFIHVFSACGGVLISVYERTVWPDKNALKGVLLNKPSNSAIVKHSYTKNPSWSTDNIL